MNPEFNYDEWVDRDYGDEDDFYLDDVLDWADVHYFDEEDEDEEEDEDYEDSGGSLVPNSPSPNEPSPGAEAEVEVFALA